MFTIDDYRLVGVVITLAQGVRVVVNHIEWEE
jgi:hypothetical protein